MDAEVVPPSPGYVGPWVVSERATSRRGSRRGRRALRDLRCKSRKSVCHVSLRQYASSGRKTRRVQVHSKPSSSVDVRRVDVERAYWNMPPQQSEKEKPVARRRPDLQSPELVEGPLDRARGDVPVAARRLLAAVAEVQPGARIAVRSWILGQGFVRTGEVTVRAGERQRPRVFVEGTCAVASPHPRPACRAPAWQALGLGRRRGLAGRL